MSDLLTAEDITSIQSAVAPTTGDSEASLIEVWRVPADNPASPVSGGSGKDKYGDPIGNVVDATLPGQQMQAVATYPARISRAGVGNETTGANQPVTIAPWTLTFNWADNPVIQGGDRLMVALSTFTTTLARKVWASGTYALGDLVQPTTSNSYYYQCTTAGTSGSTQPTWPTTTGATVVDGSITWKCAGPLRTFEVIDPGGEGSYNVVRLVRCEELEP
jgi:hypothetical protein